MSSTGTTTSTSIGLRWPASTIVTGRGPARSGRRGTARSPRAGAGWPRARSAAATRARSPRAARARGRGARRAWSPRARGSRRRSPTGRCAGPPAPARSASGTATPGVVMRTSGGCVCDPAAFVRRRVAGPDRHRRRRGRASPSRSAARPIPVSGARRFFSTSTASARSGETYRTRHRSVGGRRRLGAQPVERPQERRERLARAGRREDQRVLPVGDRRPALRSCAAVGASNVEAEPRADGGREAVEAHGAHGTAQPGHGRLPTSRSGAATAAGSDAVMPASPLGASRLLLAAR